MNISGHQITNADAPSHNAEKWPQNCHRSRVGSTSADTPRYRSERFIVSINPSASISVEESLAQRLSAMQQQLDSLRVQLMESQRLATIGTITAVIAHEFNNL